MSMFSKFSASKRLIAALALVAAGTFATRLAFAGEDVAKPAAPAATGEAPKTVETPATKTPTPFHSVMGFLAKQVAPELECACPSKPEGEKAWRGWFAGGASVPMAGLRDALVADGWTADRFVSFFQDMAKASCADCKGECKDCKGGCKDCKDCKGGCKDCKSSAEKHDSKSSAKDDASSAAAAKPAPAPASK